PHRQDAQGQAREEQHHVVDWHDQHSRPPRFYLRPPSNEPSNPRISDRPASLPIERTALFAIAAIKPCDCRPPRGPRRPNRMSDAWLPPSLRESLSSPRERRRDASPDERPLPRPAPCGSTSASARARSFS